MLNSIDPRLLTDEELRTEVAEITVTMHPWYAELTAMREESTFLPRSWRYTPKAQAIADRIKPYQERATLIGYEQDRRAKEIFNTLAWEAKDKRVASAPVYQRRNGWEIVRDMARFAVRHPVTKEEVYLGKLLRCRQVADESKPELGTDAAFAYLPPETNDKPYQDSDGIWHNLDLMPNQRKR